MYEPDEEAKALAWQRAARRQGRAVVRASFRPETWATPTDPTIILDDRPGPVSTVAMSVDWSPLIDAFKLAVQAVTQVVDEIVKTIEQAVAATAASALALDELLEQLRGLSEPDRRHHRMSSVCPRHGPTVGGLCRPCARQRSSRKEW